MSKTYDQCTWLAAHNAFASTGEGWIYAQQNLSLDDQFTHGVRCFLIDFHWYDTFNSSCKGCLSKSERYLALMHTGSIDLNRIQNPNKPKRVSLFFDKVKVWLKSDVTAIITLLIEDHSDDIGHNTVFQMLKKKNMLKYTYVKHDNKSPFPEITTMRKENRRLLLFTSNNSKTISRSPIMMKINQNIVSNHWDMSKYPKGNKIRNKTGQLALFNHFYPISIDIDFLHDYKDINSKKKIAKRLEEFITSTNKYPNFIALDYVEQGDGNSFKNMKNIIQLLHNTKKHVPYK